MSRGRGWYRESRRHSLAAKGIKTARKQPRTYISHTLDTDKDGVPDYLDCDPNDPARQDTRLNKKQVQMVLSRPVYVTDEPYVRLRRDVGRTDFNINKVSRFPTAQSKKRFPEAHYKLMAILRKYPNTINSIYKSSIDKIIFTTDKSEKLTFDETFMLPDSEGVKGSYNYGTNSIVFREPYLYTDQKIKEQLDAVNTWKHHELAEIVYGAKGLDKKELEIIHDELTRFPRDVDTLPVQEKKKRQTTAGVVEHELRHHHQEKSWSGKEKSKDESRPYILQHSERDARAHADRKLKQYDKPSKPYYNIDKALGMEDATE